MIDPLTGILLGAAGGVTVLAGLMAGDRRRAKTEFERQTGVRASWLSNDRFRAEVEGLSIQGSLIAADDGRSIRQVELSLPVSLSPSAELYVGPDNLFTKPMSFILSSWPKLNLRYPWLEGRCVRGRPEGAVARTLERVKGLRVFEDSGWRVPFFYVRRGRLELRLKNESGGSPARLKGALRTAALFAFELMG